MILESARQVQRLLWWISSKEPVCQSKWWRSNPWDRKITWRRKWQPILVFLLGEFHEQRRLLGYSPWGCKWVRQDLMTKPQGKSKVHNTKLELYDKKLKFQSWAEFLQFPSNWCLSTEWIKSTQIIDISRICKISSQQQLD